MHQLGAPQYKILPRTNQLSILCSLTPTALPSALSPDAPLGFAEDCGNLRKLKSISTTLATRPVAKLALEILT